MKPKNILPPIDRPLLWITLSLLVIGLLMVFSASSVISYQRYGNNHYYFIRQLFFGAIPGLIFMYLFSRYDYRKLQKWAPLLILVGIGLLVAVLIPSIGFQVGNARRWLNFGLFLFQPAELVKIAVILYLASWYDKRQQQIHDLYYGYLPTLAIVGLVAGLIVLEPDIGTMLIVVGISVVMFFMGGVKKRYLAATGAGALVIMWILIKAAPYRAARLLAFMHPTVDSQGISYQINQALIAIGSGGFWGVGFGQSRQKYSYLPEPMGDSIFAIMSEELGFARMLMVLGLFVAFAYRGFKIARNTTDTFGKLTAAGITSWLIVQAIINVGGITGIMPLTGVPLSFISYGSTSLLVSLAATGILLNISRHTEV